MKIVRILPVFLIGLLLLSVACSSSGSSSSAGSTDATLSGLSSSVGSLSPAFDPSVLNYAVEVSTDVSQIRLTASTDDTAARLSINGSYAESGKPSLIVQLTKDNTQIFVKVTAADGVTLTTYAVNVAKTATGTAATPQFSLPDGTAFVSSLVVSMTCATADAGIYYTTDGSTPSAASSLYSAPITLTDTTTVKMIAVKNGLSNSSVVTAVYTKSQYEQVAAPVMTPGDGATFSATQAVSIACDTVGAAVYYTTDGTAPSISSTLYSGSFSISATTTIKAIAVKSGMTNSTVTTATYTKSTQIETVVSPVFSPASGNTFTTSLSVTITSATSGASVRYTTDGTVPTVTSTLYSGAITLSATTTINAIAVNGGMTDSAVVSATYTKASEPQVSAPVFSPAGTSFTSTQTVTITSATSGALIYYTTDGTTPTAASTLYTAAITLSATTTINAIAISGGVSSSVSSAVFTKGAALDLETTYYKTNPNGQVGTYKTGMNVTCTSMKSDGFTDWSSDMIIAQGVANDVAQSFFGSHEAPLYDTYALYAAWDDTNLYLGWQYVNVVDVTDPAQGYPISDNGKPWNGDIRITLAFDTDSSKNVAGCMADGVTGAWDATGKWYNHFNNGMDVLMNFSSKPGVGTPGVFYPDANGKFSYTDTTLCKTFSKLGIVYGYVDGLLPTNVYGINKPGSWAGYTPDMLTANTGFVDFLTLGHSTTHDTFYEMKIPLTALNMTRSTLESKGIGVMLVSTFGCSAIGSIPYDPTVYDNVTTPYSADSSTSGEKEDVDTFTYNMARIGHAK